jgi:outer membrane protein assembly factor BamB
VFVATEGGDAACVSAATGDVLWTKRLAVGVDRQLASLGAEAVVVAGDDGSLTALGAAGAALWTLGAGAAASPAVPVDDKLFAYLDDKGRLALAETTTGFTVADAPPPMALRGVPAVQGGRAWAMADDQSLRLISTATRRAVRRFAVPAATEFAPTVAGERAYVVCVDGGVHAFRASGDQMFRAKIDEAPSAAAAYSKGRLYVPGQKGRLYVFDAEKGALIWRFDAKSRITATPTIVDGTIYVPTAAGTLAAVEE